mmetsp:Transcript_45836/g.143802  ORF Transcript_45836/g.143802 Transcript_45836/m.143802 type:complete len:285 (-) Transcript_45836:204-1058(-)
MQEVKHEHRCSVGHKRLADPGPDASKRSCQPFLLDDLSDQPDRGLVPVVAGPVCLYPRLDDLDRPCQQPSDGRTHSSLHERAHDRSVHNVRDEANGIVIEDEESSEHEGRPPKRGPHALVQLLHLQPSVDKGVLALRRDEPRLSGLPPDLDQSQRSFYHTPRRCRYYPPSHHCPSQPSCPRYGLSQDRSFARCKSAPVRTQHDPTKDGATGQGRDETAVKSLDTFCFVHITNNIHRRAVAVRRLRLHLRLHGVERMSRERRSRSVNHPSQQPDHRFGRGVAFPC